MGLSLFLILIGPCLKMAPILEALGLHLHSGYLSLLEDFSAFYFIALVFVMYSAWTISGSFFSILYEQIAFNNL